MEYVKSILSKEFKTYFRCLEKSREGFKKGDIAPKLHLTHKRNLYPKLRELIYVSRLIMSMQDIEKHLMPYSDMVELEREICKPLNTLTC